MPRKGETILKFPVQTGDSVEVAMPRWAQMVTVQMQYDFPMVWVIADASQPTVKRIFHWRMDGEPLVGNEDYYVGTT
jgi:hypothetical protein